MSTPPKQNFGELLRQYRQTSGLTSEKLAKWAKTTVDALSRLESGGKIQVNLDEIERLADFLGLDGQERASFFAAAPLIPSAAATTVPPKGVLSKGAPAILVFLIADVRGYTRFTLEHGDEAAAKLAQRFAMLVREVVTLRGGRLIELRGDEALACFHSVRQALHAAVEMQDHFMQATKADMTYPLPVGIGLDAGEAVPVESGYRGAALNQAARLCSLAKAGETLVSEIVTHLARKVDGLAYYPWGSAELKGFDEPVRIISVRRTAPNGQQQERRVIRPVPPTVALQPEPPEDDEEL
ncbi:MAG TPA: helix-turn-helix domain-containing protein [Ktedonobacterales bacterium]|nr:helix-turn-helix domain-containing protein [Ktedonobacterales bacterium]